jgi:hypothetical protein
MDEQERLGRLGLRLVILGFILIVTFTYMVAGLAYALLVAGIVASIVGLLILITLAS